MCAGLHPVAAVHHTGGQRECTYPTDCALDSQRHQFCLLLLDQRQPLHGLPAAPWGNQCRLAEAAPALGCHASQPGHPQHSPSALVR